MMEYKKGMTQRVCRSTLAAGASHRADGFEATDWPALLLHEALYGQDDLALKNWQNAVNLRRRTDVTDAQYVYGYLTKDGTTSNDKRMATESALLRETMRQPSASARWIGGLQNIADVFTKRRADKMHFGKDMRDSRLSLVQDAGCAAIKVTARLNKDAAEQNGRLNAAESVGRSSGSE